MSAIPKFSTTKPTMFWNKVCPFVHRSWIAALEKNADIDLYYISLGDDQPAWYAKEVNSAETVPCLMLPDAKEGQSIGTVIRESMFVAQYLDENYGVPGALQAGSPQQKHQVRQFVNACGDAIGTMYELLMMKNYSEDKEKAAELKKRIGENLLALEKQYAAASPAGPYFLGDNFGLADLTILPFLDRFRHTLTYFREFNPLKAVPGLTRLNRLVEAAEGRPSFALTSQPADFYINSYADLGYTEPTANKGTKPCAGKIYDSDNCPFCQRVKLANILKGSPFEQVDVPLSEETHTTADWYKAKVPSGVVPAIELADGTILSESADLVYFVDEASGAAGESTKTVVGNTIQPQGVVPTYETRYVLSQFNETIGDIWGTYGGDAEASNSLLNKLGYLESYYVRAAPAGPYFLGEKPTVADCILLPFWGITDALHEDRLAKLPAANGKTFAEAFPRIAGSLAAARADARLTAVLPSKASLLEKLSKKKE